MWALWPIPSPSTPAVDCGSSRKFDNVHPKGPWVGYTALGVDPWLLCSSRIEIRFHFEIAHFRPSPDSI